MTATTELSAFFENPEFDPATFPAYANAVYSSSRSRERFDELTQAFRAEPKGDDPELRVGVALYLLGKFSEAVETLAKARDTRTRRFYSAQALAALGRIDDAISELQKAVNKGWDAFEAEMQIGSLRVRAGDLEAAEKILRQHAGAGQDRGDWYCLQGMIHEAREEREAALEQYERARTLEPTHEAATFRAARLYDMLGDDDQAIDLYEELIGQPVAHVNALINLAVIYEDLGRLEDALNCLRRVLATHPNHARARLFYKDVLSSREMVIDEGGDQGDGARDRLLATPITEFELSARARNCLKKMRIATLGDLLKLSETEMLTFKNFGETSLNEVKALLAKRGLRLGQRPEDIDPASVVEAAATIKPALPPGSEALAARPVSELELSVRARRCLQRLNITNLAELIQYTEADLLAVRNFGTTSLSEIKSKLAEQGLSLAPPKA